MNITEIKKDLYKKKPIAKLHNYVEGKLWYEINVLDRKILFPIDLVEQDIIENSEKVFYYDSTGIKTTEVLKGLKISSDTKGCEFNLEMPGQFLIRWIERSIKKETFIDLIHS